MGARAHKGRRLDGILVLDKPAGMTSNAALQQAKRLLGAAKAGHTGSLDPLATGVLPLCFGEATKFSQFLLEADKRYRVTVQLGVATETGDADGAVRETRPVPALGDAELEKALAAYRGEIQQTPSMYSARKVDGQPLYKLARQGLTVEREARPISIHRLELTERGADWLTLSIHCSKGTYVRTLAEDLGEDLGCGAHVTALRRLAAGPFTERQAVTMAALEACEGDPAARLLPAAAAVQDWPRVGLTELTAAYVRQGQPVQVAGAPASGWVRIFREAAGAETFLGVGEITDDGRVAPRRLVAEPRRVAC